MKQSRKTTLIRLLCTAVIAVACTGLLATGAFAYNTAITRTPVETLTYGTFTAALQGDDLQTSEVGSYTLAPRDTPYTLTLCTEGNVERYVVLEIAAGETELTLVYCAAPGATATTFAVDTDYALTLRLTVQENAPEAETPTLTAGTTATFKRPQETPAEQPAETENAQSTETKNDTDTEKQPAADTEQKQEEQKTEETTDSAVTEPPTDNKQTESQQGETAAPEQKQETAEPKTEEPAATEQETTEITAQSGTTAETESTADGAPETATTEELDKIQFT